MALKTPDMDDCRPKKRCCGGPNSGLVYTPGEECSAGFQFNRDTCECDSILPTVGWKGIAARWSIKVTGTGDYAQFGTRYTKPGWYNGYQRGGPTAAYYHYIYLNSMYFSSSVACAGCGFTPANRNGVLHMDYTLSRSRTGLDPSDPENIRRTSCAWPEYCGLTNYSCGAYKNGLRGCYEYIVTGYIIGTLSVFDPELERFVNKKYLLFDNLDLGDPYVTPRYYNDDAPNLPMWTGGTQNVGSFYSNTCGCNDYDDPVNGTGRFDQGP